jgi:hypothetical protein
MSELLSDLAMLTGAALLLAAAIAGLRLSYRVLTAHPSEIAEARRQRREREKRKALIRILTRGARS